MKNFQEKLHTWALNTVEVYKTIAEEEENTDFTSHTAFYTQSDLARLVSSPKIVVMAINPGSNGSYREQKINIIGILIRKGRQQINSCRAILFSFQRKTSGICGVG